MLRRRIAGTVCGVAFALFSLVVMPGVATATAPGASSPAPSSVASADPGGYPAQSPLLTVSSGTAKVGGSIVISGHGFIAGEGIDISVTYATPSHALGSGGPTAAPAAFTLRHSADRTVSAGHAVATASGDFSAQVPLTQAGNATITATGEQSHLSIVATVSVLSVTTTVADTKSTKHTVPFSHTELLILLVVIVALIVAVSVTWQRRSRKPAASFDVSPA